MGMPLYQDPKPAFRGHYEYFIMPFHIGISAVLEKLRQYGLYANMSKYAFSGLVIHPEASKGTGPHPIQEWPEPTCVKDAMSFPGFTNFYQSNQRKHSTEHQMLRHHDPPIHLETDAPGVRISGMSCKTTGILSFQCFQGRSSRHWQS